MKSYLKRLILQYNFSIIIKSYLQERQARKNLEVYRKKAIKSSYSLEEEDVAAALKRRFMARGFDPIPKRKGDLHIFLTFALSNWEYVLPSVLQKFGMVTVFDWRHLVENRTEDFIDAEILRAFQKAHLQKPVDVVVGYLSGYSTNPQTLIDVAKAGAIIFNFCWDDKLNFPGRIVRGRYTSPAAIAAAVDLNLTNTPESVMKYAVHGGLAMFWPEAGHPDIHRPYNLPFLYDVSFVGGRYGWRPKFITNLKKLGIYVNCFGDGWENGPLSNEEMIKIYSQSRINLGFAGVGYSKKLMCLKGRDFEVPMSGGLYLTQDNPELSLVYNVGKEILTYKDEKDCSKKIKRLLADPSEADNIRKAGRDRALRNHTWEKRFEKVFNIAGIIDGEMP